MKLIEQRQSSSDEVLKMLEAQRLSTPWSESSYGWTTDFVARLCDAEGGEWHEGVLPIEDVMQILVSRHGHDSFWKLSPKIFGEHTSIHEAVQLYLDRSERYSENCTKLIEELQQNMVTNGFTSRIIIMRDGEQLLHIDGLHRLLALGLLIEEGGQFSEIPVFVYSVT